MIEVLHDTRISQNFLLIGFRAIPRVFAVLFRKLLVKNTYPFALPTPKSGQKQEKIALKSIKRKFCEIRDDTFMQHYYIFGILTATMDLIKSIEHALHERAI